MAFDPEARRAQREKLRQQRQRQQRRLWVRLVAAAVVVVACGVLIFLARRGSPEGQPPPVESTAAALQTQPDGTQPAPTEPTTVIHFAAAGDLNICDEVVSAGGGTYDYSQAFLDVLPLLADADLTALNFEGNLVGPPYGTERVSAPESMLTALREAGVDILQVANSCSINNGIIGLTSTLQAIRSAGLEPVGAYATSREFRESGGYVIREVQGIRVAIVAFTKGMGNMALPEGNEDCVNLLYTDYATTYQTIDREGITAVLRNAQRENPDITIALLHWGSEYNDKISDTQTAIRNLMLDEGVDVIIGTHPHYVQAMEFDQENGTFVCYSLGDFFGSAARSGTAYSAVLNLEITRDNLAGTTKVTGYTYTPIYTVAGEGGYRVVRLREAMTAYEGNYLERVEEATYEDMVYAATRIAERVTPPTPEEE